MYIYNFTGLRDTGLDGDLVRWVASFLSNRRALRIIDGHTGEEVPYKLRLATGLTQI